MKSTETAWRRRYRTISQAALLVAAVILTSAARADGSSGVAGSPIDLSAFVHDAILPGGTVFEDTHSVQGAFTDPKQSADYLYFPSKGVNFSGRSTNIQRAFASSLAESNGNGGVGVTSWIAGDPGSPHQNAVGQLVSRATWKQDFTYNGSTAASISLALHIPALEVGLIGVAPNRDAVSATETAQAEATVQSTITHADGSSARGASFDFGLRTFEQQVLLGPGTFANFADIQFLGANNGTVDLFQSFLGSGDPSNPRFTVDSVSANVRLGTLQPGDTVSYVYTLTAQGTTHGGEHGYMAFLGDPFGVDITSGNLLLSAAPVPEPATWMLSLAGLILITGALRRRRGTRAAACHATAFHLSREQAWA